MEKNPNLNEESGNKALYFTDAEFKYEKTEVEKSLQKYGIDNPIVSFETLFKCNAYMTQKGKYWKPLADKYVRNHPRFQNKKKDKKSHFSIFNLATTISRIDSAYHFLLSLASNNSARPLFVSTKLPDYMNKQAIFDFIAENAIATNSCYVNKRWLGGTITNFNSVCTSIQKLHTLVNLRNSDEWRKYTKKENVLMEKNIFRLQGLVGGISKINVDRAKTNVKNVISVLIVTDFIRERKSIMEAKKKGVPIIALCNTNCYVDDIVDHVIPINTNSIRSIILVIGILFDALRQGQEQFINRDCEEILTSINNIIATNSANTSDSKDNLVEATTNTMINHKKKIRSHE